MSGIIYRTLKDMESLNLKRTETQGSWGYKCQDSDCFINDDMVYMFDGVTKWEFQIDDIDYGEHVNIYGFRCLDWSFNKIWFVEGFQDWLAEEDFTL